MPTHPKIEAINEETKAAIDARLAISLHGDNLVPHAAALVTGDSPLGETIYKSGRLGMRALYETLSAAETAVEVMLAPKNVTVRGQGEVVRKEVPPERRPQLHAALMAALGRSVRTFDSNLAAAEDSVGKLGTKIDATLADPNGHKPSAAAAASDIRQILRQYSPEQRIPAIHAAIREGDIEVTRAVLSATPFASGLERKDFAILRDLAEQKFAPTEYAQRAAGQAVLKKMTTARDAFADRYAKLLPKMEESAADKSLNRLRSGTGA
jgi:hypothetical protein